MRLYAPPSFGAPPPADAVPAAPDPTAAPSSSAPPPDAPSLGAVYRDLVAPDLIARGRTSATLSDQRTHLRSWSEAWAALREPEPPAAAVRLVDLQRYRTWLTQTLRANDGTAASPRTINKYLGTIQQVGRAAVRHGLAVGFPILDKLPTEDPSSGTCRPRSSAGCTPRRARRPGRRPA